MPSNEREFQIRLRTIFEAEATEHLRALTDGLFALGQTADSKVAQEIVEMLFRVVHTLKGGARVVQEREAERICQELETLFFNLKNQGQGRVLGSAEREALNLAVDGLRSALRLAPSLSAPSAPLVQSAPEGSVVSSDQPAGETRSSENILTETRSPVAPHVRVPAARLDALLAQSEEMFATKASAAQHVEALQQLSHRVQSWKKHWGKLRPRLTPGRLGAAAVDASAQRDLKKVWQFLEWNQEFVSKLENDLAHLTRDFGREQRWSGGLIDGLLEQTKEVLMLPFTSLTESFPGFMREYSATHEKPIELRIDGGETQVDRRVLEEIKDAILHLVRNAIDHGIESQEERQKRGKPLRGTLTISVVPKSGSSVEISVRDDGGGIDVEVIRRAAIRQNILREDDEGRSEGDLLSLLFRSGFSTRSEVTDLSGRGLGLAIVEEKVERLGGSVTIDTTLGTGTAFRLLLPITMARFRGIFVHAAGRDFVISSAFVVEILRISSQEIRLVKSQPTIEFQGQPVLLLPLAGILGLPADPDEPEVERRFVVLIRSGQTAVAIAVDDAPYESEVIMKDLGRLLPRVRNIAGATTVGSGKIIPVLNATDLVRSALRRKTQPSVAALHPTSRVETPRRILIVEDSITSRTLLKNVLEAAGFQVRTAFDGIEAMTLLQYEPIDLIVSDVQMPRMDGVELTRRIRADAALSTLPVILVTSLAGREDKERGVEAGANAYIVKSSFDQSDLLKTVERLL